MKFVVPRYSDLIYKFPCDPIIELKRHIFRLSFQRNFTQMIDGHLRRARTTLPNRETSGNQNGFPKRQHIKYISQNVLQRKWKYIKYTSKKETFFACGADRKTPKRLKKTDDLRKKFARRNTQDTHVRTTEDCRATEVGKPRGFPNTALFYCI